MGLLALVLCLQSDRLPEGAVLRLGPHADGVKTVSWSPDGRSILTGCRDGTLALWEASTGKKLRVLEGHAGGVTCAVFSADGGRILSGSQDRTLALWDAGSGERLRSFQGHEGWIKGVAFRPDGKHVVSISLDGKLITWDLETGKPGRTVELAPRDVMSMTLSPDGGRALVGVMDFFLVAWDVERGEKIRSLQGHTGWVMSSGASHDGRLALSGSWDRTLILWNVDTGVTIKFLPGHASWALSMAFSPDDRIAASGSRDHSVVVWDLAGGAPIVRYTGHAGSVQALAFSPGGRFVVSASEDGTALLWHPASGLSEAADRWHTGWKTRGEEDRRKELSGLAPALAATSAREYLLAQEKILRAGPEGVRFLSDTFSAPPVRAADETRLGQLLSELDSDEFATRVKAQRELKTQGLRIVAWLEERLKDAGLSAEVRGALTDVKTFLLGSEPALQAQARTRAVLTLLEMPRTEEVTGVLRRFAEGPEDDQAGRIGRRALPK